MRRRVLKTVVLVSAVGLSLGRPGALAHAAAWADALFAERAHDFGTVPRGAKVRHNFVLKNETAEPVSILNVRASCGCTTGRPSRSLVEPGASATVEAEMDTRNFVGKKATTLHVALVSAGGREAEVKLSVSSTILSDIVLNPGTIDFGSVSRGQTPTQTLTVERVGMPGWKVERIVSACKAIDATLTETARDGQGVVYLLKVNLLPGMPSGAVRDEIRLLTNDPETPAFPVLVTATIRGDLTASPSVLALGHVPSAGSVQGRFLIRSTRPFAVRAIEGDGDGFKASVDDLTSKPVHIVTVTYRRDDGSTRGDLRRAFRVHSDLAGEAPLDLTATVHVEP
jgi:hypothetical protein